MTRQTVYLKERYKAISLYIGRLLLVLAGLYTVPVVMIIFYPDELGQVPAFLITAIGVGFIGSFLKRTGNDTTSSDVSMQEGAVIIVAIWIASIVSGTIPFMLNVGLSFPQALFESASGWTTTGLSVVDVEAVSHMILFYRSFIQLIGGGGFAIIALTMLTGRAGMGLMNAEGRTDQLAPHIRQTAKIVIRIYLVYIIGGTIALWLAGMDWFDALNHAFAALSTGGFSTQVNSIGHWDSAIIEAVTIALMTLGTVNFLTVYLIIQGNVRAVFQNEEIRFMLTLMTIGISLTLILVTLGLYPNMEKAVRVAVFEIVSAVTTTGFSTVGYSDWSALGWSLLIVFMLIGGGTGSTAGGIKQLRIFMMIKTIWWEVKRMLQPANMVNSPTISHGSEREKLTDKQIRHNSTFIGLYFLCFIIGTFFLVASDYPLKESLFEMASTLSTVGLSSGITSPDMNIGLFIMMSIGMLLGRLEFFTVLIGFAKSLSDGISVIRD